MSNIDVEQIFLNVEQFQQAIREYLECIRVFYAADKQTDKEASASYRATRAECRGRIERIGHKLYDISRVWMLGDEIDRPLAEIVSAARYGGMMDDHPEHRDDGPDGVWTNRANAVRNMIHAAITASSELRHTIQIRANDGMFPEGISAISTATTSQNNELISPIDYIDLDQASVLVNRSKRTLERSLSDGKMPQPDIEGVGGKKHEWDYAKLKPWLEKEFGRLLPPRPPHVIR